MRLRGEVRSRADPGFRAPGEEFQRLVVHAAACLDMRVVPRQHVKPVDVARAFLNGAEIRAAANTVQIFLAHLGGHPSGIVVENDRQVGGAVDGQRMKRVLARRRLGIGRCRHQQRVISHAGDFGRELDRILGADGAGSPDHHSPGADNVLGAAQRLQPLFRAVRVIFAGRATDDDPVHTCGDEVFEDRSEPVPVDLAILPQRRDGRRVNAPDFHDSTTETFVQTRLDHRACASFRQ